MKKYKLVVHFNEYTGNFHREFNAFVLAVGLGYEDSNIDSLIQQASSVFTKEDQDPDDAMDDLLEYYHHFYDEYGTNVSELTQVETSNGDFECHGISVHFDKDPTNILPIILSQIAAFPAMMKTYRRPQNVKILKIELVTETISKEVKVLTLPE